MFIFNVLHITCAILCWQGQFAQAGFTTGQARLPAPRQRNPPIGDDWAGFSMFVGVDDGPGAGSGQSGFIHKVVEVDVHAAQVRGRFRPVAVVTRIARRAYECRIFCSGPKFLTRSSERRNHHFQYRSTLTVAIL